MWTFWISLSPKVSQYQVQDAAMWCECVDGVQIYQSFVVSVIDVIQKVILS